jgi:conjugative transposon TraK protein
MFNKPKNIETAFQYSRAISALVVVCATFFCCYVKYESGQELAQAASRVYVLSSGKAMEVLAANRKDNIPVEARDHVRAFHEAFFTLDPDEQVIQRNIGRALYLADGSAKQLYDNLRESGYYAGLISGNISQELRIDSIALDMRSYPYSFRCSATMRIIRPTSIVTRDLVTEGYLRETSRSDHNPHGFLIERWSTIENKDITIEKR